jgi:hypothetical protein
MSTRSLQTLLLAFAVVAACDKAPETKAPPSSGGDQAKKSDPAPQAEGGQPEAKDAKDAKDDGKTKVVEGAPPGQDERYALQIETPEAKAGQESKVTVKVVPKEPWHMNLDFPTSLAVTASDGVALSKDKLKKADAELSEASCQFDVAFTPAKAGDAKFTGEFKFAVCQDEACAPVTENVEFQVAVK